jgi:hypothetical protein
MAFGPHDVADNYTETDFLGGYVQGAQAIQAGHLDPARYAVVGPVYEITLALIGFLSRDLWVAGKLISVAAAWGTLLFWFLLLERRVGAVAGLWTLSFLAVNPILVRYGSSTTTDALATLVQAAALLVLFGRSGRWTPLWAGLLTGVAVLTRYNAIYLLPIALASEAWRPSSGSASRRRVAALFLAGFASLTVPWLARSIAWGHWPGEGLFHNVAFDVFGRGQGVSWDEYQTRLGPQFGSLWDVVGHDPAGLLHRWLDNLHRHVLLDMERLLGWPAAIACAVGLVLSLADGSWRRLLPLWAAGALLYATLVPVFHSERYSLPLAPIYLTLAGAAVASPRVAFSVRGWPVPLKWALASGALMASALGSAAYQRRVIDDLPREVRSAAATLRAAAQPGSRVLARKPHIGFYSGLIQVPFPTLRTLSELAAFCRRERVEFIYFSSPEAELRPEFTYLLDPEADVPGLIPLRFSAPRPARLYRVEPEFGATPAWFGDDSLRTLRVVRSLGSIGAPMWRAALVSGLYALDQKDFEAAARHFAILVRVRPDFAQGYFLAGEAYRNLGELDAAADAYTRAIGLDPSRLDARVGLGWVSLRGGNLTAAAGAWRPVVTSVGDPATLRAMAQVFDRVGDEEAARLARETLSHRASPTGGP